MDGIEEQILRIEGKVALLLKEYSLAKKEIQRLQKENTRLSELLHSSNDKNNKTNHQENVIKIDVKNLKNHAKKDLEKRIDAYLKDIDKCLALLHS